MNCKKFAGAITLLLLFFSTPSFATNSYSANDASSLSTAYTSAAAGDTIKFTANIVVTSTWTISKAIVISGQGYTLSVPVVGMSDAGVINPSASAFRPITFSASGLTVIVNNLKIQGGGNVQGAGVYIPASNTVTFNYCTISNSVGSSTFIGGGGIYNAGNCYLFKTAVTRNAAQFGGGFLNTGGAKMYIEYSTFTENRSLNSNGGGGAGESNSSSFLYVNNSAFCNNQATNGGGAINNYMGTAYVANTTFSGNICDNTFQGGAFCNIGTSSYLVNCLFAYNYYKSAPSSGAPTTLTLNDALAYSGTINMYYCTYMANTVTSGTFNYAAGNTVHALAADGSTNDIFTGGLYATMYDVNGLAYGTAQYFQPFLIKVNGIGVPTIKTGSWALGKGVVTGFTNGGGTPSMGYYNGSSWVNILGSAASANQVTDDETNTTRAATPAVGGLEKTVDNYVSLKVFGSSNGTVNNASIYGDLYPSGTAVTITAIPNTGYAFSNFTYNLGGSGTLSSNPLTVTLNSNTIFTPTFITTTGFAVTYLDNGATSGSLPGTPVASYASGATATIVGNTGGLNKTGFTFAGWNTQPNGSGTTYTSGNTYSSSSAINLTLYALWNSTGVVLPVKLLNFTVTPTNSQTAIVNWQTATEMNSQYFEIQKSTDGLNWQVVAQVNSKGNSANGFKYSFIDPLPYLGRSYYRLKQVDIDGKPEFSAIQSINITTSNANREIQAYPNPAKDIVYIKSDVDNIRQLVVYDNLGKDVSSQCKINYTNGHLCSVQIQALPKGYYWIKTNGQVVAFMHD